MRHRPRIGPSSARSTQTFHAQNHERSLGHRTDPARTDVRTRFSARRRQAHEERLAARCTTRRGTATGACIQSLKLRKATSYSSLKGHLLLQLRVLPLVFFQDRVSGSVISECEEILQAIVGRARPLLLIKLRHSPTNIRLTLYHGGARSPEPFHCSQTNQETMWIFRGKAKLEDW